MADDEDRKWDLQTAKGQLEELLFRARNEGPQVLTVDGREVGAVVSLLDLRRLQKRQPTFKAFILGMPSLEGVDLERDPRPPRDIDLG